MKPLSFKDYVKYLDDEMSSKTRKRLNKKTHKGRFYGGLMYQNTETTDGGDANGVGESFLSKEESEEIVDIKGAGEKTPNPFNQNKKETSDKQTIVTKVEKEPTEEDPNKQGILRQVKKAKLVYKRRTPEGTFEELWIYNTGNSLQDEVKIRKDILAGTDIPPNKTKSADGSQYYEITTLGNAQLLKVTGLPQ
ncbi:MAG: hypothetical protein QXL17_02665 [Candidatus Thermoplasmatota archaeon]